VKIRPYGKTRYQRFMVAAWLGVLAMLLEGFADAPDWATVVTSVITVASIVGMFLSLNP
jgi:hypothetical protein